MLNVSLASSQKLMEFLKLLLNQNQIVIYYKFKNHINFGRQNGEHLALLFEIIDDLATY
jgi:hypothetical protein